MPTGQHAECPRRFEKACNRARAAASGGAGRRA